MQEGVGGGRGSAMALRLRVRSPRPQGSSGLEEEEGGGGGRGEVPEWHGTSLRRSWTMTASPTMRKSENLDRETFFFGDGDERRDDEGYD